MPTDGPTPELSDQLRDELMREWDKALPHQEPMGADLIARYSEPHRRYHGTAHLASVLSWVDRLAGDHDLFLVRLAAWFHDAVYAIPPLQVTNEEASARLAFRELSRAGLEQEDLNQVARLVRITAIHSPGTRDPEGELLCDADLAILAAPPEEYRAYTEAVRAEYADVGEEEFLAGRLEIMTELVETDIFRTSKGRALVEPARANVTAEIAQLQEQYSQLVGRPWDEL